MADDKDNPGFLRNVARFVANPTTDWADLNTNGEENRESEFAKSEIKAMIERKRRNDFVRKREFDMLRKIRREGLAGSVDNGIGMSNLDSEPRAPDGGARSDIEVKAKIDAIEQQMVGESLRRHAAQQEHNSAFFNAPTQPATLPGGMPSQPPSLDADTISAEVVAAARSAGHSTAAVVVGAGLNKPPVVGAITGIGDIDVSEVVHDPELDEAVIAFANADFDQCERSAFLPQRQSPAGCLRPWKNVQCGRVSGYKAGRVLRRSAYAQACDDRGCVRAHRADRAKDHAAHRLGG
jgi:hypothetical protein